MINSGHVLPLGKEGALLGVVHGCISGVGNDIEKDHKRAKFVSLLFK